jgi:hypothetical protein
LILIDGPHDGEQCIAGQLAFGMDHADYLMARAPKPTLVCCATRDFFPIAGTWDTYRMTKRFYTRLGYPERLEIAEADEEHGFTPMLRQAMVRWMKRWLLNVDDTATEPDITPLTDEEALVTTEGQVLKIAGERSVWDVNKDLSEKLTEERKAKNAARSKDELLKKVREITGIRPLAELPMPEVSQTATSTGDGFRLEKLVIKPEPGIVLPALLYIPTGQITDFIVAVSEFGKERLAPLCEHNAKAEGWMILAVDLRNNGETESKWSHGDDWERKFGPSYKSIMLAYLLDRPMLTMWAEDILVAARYLRDRSENTAHTVKLYSEFNTGAAALHAAALDTDGMFTKLKLMNAPDNWAFNTVMVPGAPRQLVNAVHGALREYDQPDLMGSLSIGASVGGNSGYTEERP